MISQHYGATKKRHRDFPIEPEDKGGQKSGPSRKTQGHDAHGSAQAESETTPVFVLEIEEASDGLVLVHGRAEAQSQAVLLQIKGFDYCFYLEAKAIDDSEEPGMPAEVSHLKVLIGLLFVFMPITSLVLPSPACTPHPGGIGPRLPHHGARAQDLTGRVLAARA